MLTPWLHSNLFVAGTTVRSDEMNTKLSGIATAFQQITDHVNSRIMTLPPNFVGNAALPEKSYLNSIPYFNTDGNADLYSMAMFDASVQLAIQKAADAAASQAAALASENAAKSSEDQALEYRDAAQSSEIAAASSAATAVGSATAAGISASNAANSATAAGISATNAANSATAANSSVIAAAGSAANAASSATTADNRAIAAASSATSASNSATAASNSATSANTSKTAAEAAASAAAGSSTTAEYWAGQAQTGGQQVYKGLWNASGNTFPSATTMGWTYKVSAASSASLAASNFTDATARFLNTGDTIIWNAPLSKWDWFADAASGLTPTAGRADATSGRAVRAGDAASPSGDYRFDGIDTTTVNTATSWNSVTGVGIYKEPLRGNNTGGPGGTGGYVVQNIQASATTLIQYAHPISANSGLSAYSRTQVGGSWGAWRQMLDSANLSQFVQSSQTDATPGKLMPVGAFGLGADAATVTDINAITRSGYYKCASDAVGVPIACSGMLHHINADTTFGTQTYFCYGVNIGDNQNRVFVRHKDSATAGVWEQWHELWTSNNLVKQSSAADTTAGALMAVGAFGLGVVGAGINLSNIDAINIPTGLYNCVTATTGVKPGGFTTNMTVMVHLYDTDQVTQLCTETTTARQFFRTYALTAWTAWQELFHSGNLTKQSSAADTTAGALMAVGAFGLGTSPISISGSNVLNGLTASGFYKILGSNVAGSGAPPGASGGVLQHLHFDSNYATQIYQDVTSGNPMQWIRHKNNGTWTTWFLVWNGSNLFKQNVPTDTAAGALMAVGAFGLGASIPPQVTNWNDAVRNGWYYSLSGATNVPKSAGGWQGIVISLNSENVRQLVWSADGPAVEMYSRCGDGTTLVWAPWEKIVTSESAELTTARAANANLTVARSGKETKVQAVSDTTNLTLTIPTGYSAGDRIELSLSVASGRVITLSSVTSMAVVNGTAGASHSITGPIHMNVVMVNDGTNWQLTVS
ncbi:MAG: pyocin knob domain-containing protein [Rheinheimera sp.]|nr:pyocin knob domain-containing protein [Rheinheimera sp.]